MKELAYIIAASIGILAAESVTGSITVGTLRRTSENEVQLDLSEFWKIHENKAESILIRKHDNTFSVIALSLFQPVARFSNTEDQPLNFDLLIRKRGETVVHHAKNDGVVAGELPLRATETKLEAIFPLQIQRIKVLEKDTGIPVAGASVTHTANWGLPHFVRQLLRWQGSRAIWRTDDTGIAEIKYPRIDTARIEMSISSSKLQGKVFEISMGDADDELLQFEMKRVPPTIPFRIVTEEGYDIRHCWVILQNNEASSRYVFSGSVPIADVPKPGTYTVTAELFIGRETTVPLTVHEEDRTLIVTEDHDGLKAIHIRLGKPKFTD